ncbi:MAG: hypothetical protein ISS92_03845 [Candidatus Omnitrophica bacterium]|nr:hypothetical protein [Candidatus Omnitrophota bacterium]
MSNTLSIIKGTVILLLLVIFGTLSVSADTIELKNGKTVSGTITEETEKYVVVAYYGDQSLICTISKEDIRNIKKTSQEEYPLQKEGFPIKKENFWQKIVNKFKKTGVSTKKDEDYLLKKYEWEVEKAKRRKPEKEAEEKESEFRDFKKRYRKCPYAK